MKTGLSRITRLRALQEEGAKMLLEAHLAELRQVEQAGAEVRLAAREALHGAHRARLHRDAEGSLACEAEFNAVPRRIVHLDQERELAAGRVERQRGVHAQARSALREMEILQQHEADALEQIAKAREQSALDEWFLLRRGRSNASDGELSSF